MFKAELRPQYSEEEYKRLHEAFVSDHYGGSQWEILAVTLVAPTALILWSLLQARHSFFTPYTALAKAADFLLHCCAILFATTIYSNEPQMLLSLIFLPVITIRFFHSASTSKKAPQKPTANGTDKKNDDAPVVDPLPVKPFVTHYRGAMMVATCICILAVDFPVFPRRFAKTESLGTSLMDLGVGSFVFSAGIVSVRQQLKEQNGDAKRSNFLQRFISSFKHSIPLVVLGLVRLYSVKKLGYVEHVTEYGVHWNFFFTLASIPPFVAIFQSIFKLVPHYAILAYVISLLVEMCYTWTDLLHWLAFAPREGFVNSNKEGLISIPGYLAIYLAGQGIGMVILQRDQTPESTDAQNDIWLAQTLGGDESASKVQQSSQRFAWLELAKWSGIWCVLYQFSTGKYGPKLIVSRRFANMAYFIWVCAFNTVQLWIFCTIESLFFLDLYEARHKHVEIKRIRAATSRVLNAFNRNGLALFLLANLLTGAINLNLRTVLIDTIPAMLILVGYMATLTIVALTLDTYNIKLGM